MEPSINSAIRRGFFQQVRYLIEFGQSVDSRDSERRTPLISCALVQDTRWGVGLARMLIEKHAGMSARDRRGMNVMHYAAIHDRRELVKLLLTSPDFDITQGDLLGNTALHYAVTRGHVEITRLLVQVLVKYSLKIDKPNRRGITALMQAWKSGNEDCAMILLHEGHADETLQEPSELKSAKDFEEEYRNSKDNQRDDLDSSHSTRGYVQLASRRRRPMSASALSQSSMASSSRSLRARPRSAMLLDRRSHSRTNTLNRRSATPFNRRHPEDQQQEDPDLLTEVEKEKPSGKLYKSANANDLRNKPEYIFNLTPIECFTSESQYKSAQKRPSLCSVSENQQPPVNSWKSELKDMYSTFDFQFTHSYRSSARPPEVDPSEGDERDGSPHPSDGDVSLEKIARRTRSKINVKNALTVDKPQRKGSGKGLQRKISSTSSLKSQQTSLDTSSCESVNSSVRASKKRSQTSDDCSDVSAAETKANKNNSDSKTCKNGAEGKAFKSRTRKISSGSAEGEPDASMRGTARGLPIPSVKEPTGQDQLKAIRE